jgi:5'-3' exoribonuclease 2
MLNIPILNTSISYEINSIEYNPLFIKDYIFMCFLLGNDFLPHFPALNIRTNGIYHLIEVYQQTLLPKKLFLIQENHIVWKNVSLFIQELAKYEYNWILEELEIRNKIEMKLSKLPMKDMEVFENTPILKRNIELAILPEKKYWQSRYYRYLLNMHNDINRKKQICQNYFEGLEWTFYYYQGKQRNNVWYYKYTYPPLLEDLTLFVPSHNQLSQEYFPIKELTQLCYVIPKESFHLLPKHIINKLKKEWYPDTYHIQWSFCKYFWESHLQLPFISIYELDELI